MNNMTYTWVDLARKFLVRSEQKPDAKVTIGGIKEAIQRDLDYKYMIPCIRGEIYRYSDDGRFWGVYLKPTKGGIKRRALWAKFDAMGLTRVQTGDFEAAWKFGAERLEEVASLLKVRRRGKNA